LITVAVIDNERIDVGEPQKLKIYLKQLYDETNANPYFMGLEKTGTIGDIPSNDDGGDWPTKNWRSISWGKGSELFDHFKVENFIKGSDCY